MQMLTRREHHEKADQVILGKYVKFGNKMASYIKDKYHYVSKQKIICKQEMKK